jgi:predicted RecB family nuclease
MDFITARIDRHPFAHIYHYASYEETALKRLAMVHGTREIQVDDLLRRRNGLSVPLNPSLNSKSDHAFYCK